MENSLILGPWTQEVVYRNFRNAMIEIGVLGFGTESAKNYVLFHLSCRLDKKPLSFKLISISLKEKVGTKVKYNLTIGSFYRKQVQTPCRDFL